MIPFFLFNGTRQARPSDWHRPWDWPIHLGELGRRDALQEFEFVPSRIQVRDFVARGFA
jgi:hypothetical protein